VNENVCIEEDHASIDWLIHVSTFSGRILGSLLTGDPFNFLPIERPSS